MADYADSTEQDAARLEAALARIARARAAPRPAQASAAGQAETADLRARLDDLISELRSVLGRDSAD